jgi:hypothetical protein
MMAKLTLESLAKRVEALETALAVKETQRSPKDWRKAVGLFAGSDFMKQVDEEGRRIREADREAAHQEAQDDCT